MAEEKTENKDEILNWLKEQYKPGYDALFKQFNETEASVILDILKIGDEKTPKVKTEQGEPKKLTVTLESTKTKAAEKVAK